MIPELAKNRRVVAPDMLGFGYTERPEDNTYNRERWVAHAIGVMDALDLQQVDLVGTPSVAAWPWPWLSSTRNGCAAWC